MPLSAMTGSRIRQRRGLIGLRQAELARLAGISASYLNLIEHNRRKVGGAVLGRIAAALGVEIEALSGGAQDVLLDDLREAVAGALAETDSGAGVLESVEEFAGRFPGWAALVGAQQARLAQLERAVEALSDRMSHDPHLSAALHEVLSAAASVRSTAAILADTPDIEAGWRTLFERNLADDSARLAEGAEALVAYLDGAAEQEAGIAAPQEELEAWLGARGWHFPELEALVPDAAAPEQAVPVAQGVARIISASPELASRAARRMAADWIEQARLDARALPLDMLAAHLRVWGPDPALIARAAGVDAATVFRRLALLPGGVGTFGLVVCDGSGTLVFRKPVPGFGLPRFGAACPLWPLYQALSRPSFPVRAWVVLPGAVGARFLTFALCLPDYPEGFAAAPVLRAYMLVVPDAGAEGGGPNEVDDAALLPIGTSCRICPRGNCSARREPAIMSEGG